MALAAPCWEDTYVDEGPHALLVEFAEGDEADRLALVVLRDEPGP